MERFDTIPGVPVFEAIVLAPKRTRYCLLIPIIDEMPRIHRELLRAHDAEVNRAIDIIVCDGGSTDGGADPVMLSALGVSALLNKKSGGRQGAQLRMGIWWALRRGYLGVITIDGNDKDSIEDVPSFIEKLDQGYDFVQGSRFVPGGRAERTPWSRYLAVRLLHAPIISLTAGHRFTDTTNAYRAYSAAYLNHPHVQPMRDVFVSYELLAYLSVRASQLGLRCCEIPVVRAYPKHQKAPTKLSPLKGNGQLLKILFLNLLGRYRP